MSAAEWQVMCIFKALHIDPREQHKDVSLEEFYSFYELRDLRWKKVSQAYQWLGCSIMYLVMVVSHYPML